MDITNLEIQLKHVSAATGNTLNPDERYFYKSSNKNSQISIKIKLIKTQGNFRP